MRIKLLPKSVNKFIDIKGNDFLPRIYNERWLTIINRIPLLLDPDQQHKNYYKFIFNTANSKFSQIESTSFIYIRGTAWYASNPYSRNFAHFMVQEVASVLMARKLGIINSKIKLLVANETAFQQQLWQLLFPDKQIEIVNIEHNKCYIVENCFYSELSFAMRWNKYIIDTFKPIAKLCRMSDIPQKVYISRQDTSTRLVVNEKEVIEYLGQRGFQTLSFTNLPVARQIAVYAQAEEIVSPHGANGALLLFAHDKLKFTEIFNEYRVTSNHASNLVGTSARYVGAVGQCVNNVSGIDSNYLIEKKLLDLILEDEGQVITLEEKETMPHVPRSDVITEYLNTANRHLRKAQDQNLPVSVRHAEFQAAVAADPDNVGKKYLHLSFLLAQKLYKELLEQCAVYKVAAPKWGYPDVALAILHERSGEVDEALKHARNACELDPMNRGYMKHLLNLLKKYQRWEELGERLDVVEKKFSQWEPLAYFRSLVDNFNGVADAALPGNTSAIESGNATHDKH